MLKQMRAEDDRQYANRMVLAEANQWPADVRAYFGDGDECHMAFHFPLMSRVFMALQQEDRHPITEILKQTPDIPENCQWALFLRNHDELTLEMVTDEERDYMYRVYASDPQMRINLGIRRRLAALMNYDRRHVELMNGLLFSLPGNPRSTTATRSEWATTITSGIATASARRCSGAPTGMPGSRGQTLIACTCR
jgi:maltose alpha-D-glucosyltransferase/alpha-amylase